MTQQMQQPELPPHDYDNARYESIKIEQNSKGVNVAVRTVRSDRETQEQWLQRTVDLYNTIRNKVQ